MGGLSGTLPYSVQQQALLYYGRNSAAKLRAASPLSTPMKSSIELLLFLPRFALLAIKFSKLGLGSGVSCTVLPSHSQSGRTPLVNIDFLCGTN